jgi:hypothetical protein
MKTQHIKTCEVQLKQRGGEFVALDTLMRKDGSLKICTITP